MSLLEHILPLVDAELAASHDLIHEKISSQVPLAKEISEYVLKQGGKRLRPALVLLSAKLFQADMQKAILLASVVEMLHTATLLHDDVIDESMLRRNQPSANARFGNEASVLVGDLLYARAFQLITELNHPAITQALSEATSVIVEGEILQLSQKQDIATDQATYLNIVRCKTGRLFQVAALAGPLLANASQANCQKMASYGEALGIAFQMHDDALDYIGHPDVIGKNLGDDLAEGKPTLPLIYALAHAAPLDQALVKTAIQAGGRAHLEELLAILHRSGALDYASQQARLYAAQAKAALTNLPNSEYLQALALLADFSVQRSS